MRRDRARRITSKTKGTRRRPQQTTLNIAPRSREIPTVSIVIAKINADPLLRSAQAPILVHCQVMSATLDCGFLKDPAQWYCLRYLLNAEELVPGFTQHQTLERADWRMALCKGVGFCSQQSMVIADFAEANCRTTSSRDRCLATSGECLQPSSLHVRKTARARRSSSHALVLGVVATLVRQ